jgi:SNF2 family DNA or RNA helicase
MTGTAMKNSMDEFYAVMSAIGIAPFGTMWEFGEEFCIFRKQYIGKGRHKMLLVGYKNVDRFKKGIRSFYLGRSPAQVKEPLPRLLTTYHPIDLDDRQAKLLLEDIPSGKFVLPPTVVTLNGEIFEQERDPDNMMTMLSVQQLIANHPGLLDRNDEKEFLSPKLSPKEEALLDLLDGDLKGEKVIVFTKFLRHIDRLNHLSKGGKFTDRKFLRITGNENEKQRNTAKRLFQENPENDLIFINAAGIEGLNLQQAAHMVCLDLPWSWGDLIQLVGRMVRSASPHSLCTLHILVSKGTVDEYTIDILKGKKGVFEAILGESQSAGLLGGEEDMDLGSGMECGSDDEFRLALLKKAHVRATSMKKFLEGDRIEMARGGGQYHMIFEKNTPKSGNRKAESEEDELAKVWEPEL